MFKAALATLKEVAANAYNIPLSKVTRATSQGNNEISARVIEFSGTEYMIRAKGYAKSRKD